MTDTKLLFRSILINYPALTALVPVARITQAWPTKDAVFPCIAFSESNNSNDDMDYANDAPISEISEMQVDVFCAPGTSSTAIAQALDAALYAEQWNRDFSMDLVEPDTGLIHRVARYSKRVYY